MSNNAPTSKSMNVLLQRAADGDAEARDAIITRHRRRLTRLVQMRLSPKLQGRVDASDVVQEAQLEVAHRLDSYLQNPRAPFYRWVHEELTS